MGRSRLPGSEPLSAHFVIFGLPRTGSSLLGALLDGQPGVSCDTEILHPCMWPGWSRLAYWGWHVLPDLYISRRAAEADRSGLAAYGFKLFPAHVAAPRRVILSLHQRGWHVIHIKRRCLFEQTLSLLVAEQTGRYDGTHTDSVPRITIDPARFGAALHQRAGDIRKIERILASLSCLDIIYEDDLADSLCWDATVNRVCGFLGIAAAAAWSDYAKTWSAPYDQIVVNYRHLRDVYRAGLLGER